MDPAQVSPPATPPLPARPVPAADPQQQVLPPVDMWTVPSVHSAEPPPQREFRELPAQPTGTTQPAQPTGTAQQMIGSLKASALAYLLIHFSLHNLFIVTD